MATNTRLRVIGSNGKTAFGLVGCPFAICRRARGLGNGSGGQLLHDAIETAKGKPGSPLRSVYIGQPWRRRLRGWWHDLVKAGSHGSTYVQLRQGSPGKWDSWHTIRKAEPTDRNFGRLPKEAVTGAGQGSGGYSAQGSVPVLPAEPAHVRRTARSCLTAGRLGTMVTARDVPPRGAGFRYLRL